jgi:hypothetical protein
LQRRIPHLVSATAIAARKPDAIEIVVTEIKFAYGSSNRNGLSVHERIRTGFGTEAPAAFAADDVA